MVFDVKFNRPHADSIHTNVNCVNISKIEKAGLQIHVLIWKPQGVEVVKDLYL